MGWKVGHVASGRGAIVAMASVFGLSWAAWVTWVAWARATAGRAARNRHRHRHRAGIHGLLRIDISFEVAPGVKPAGRSNGTGRFGVNRRQASRGRRESGRTIHYNWRGASGEPSRRGRLRGYPPTRVWGVEPSWGRGTPL